MKKFLIITCLAVCCLITALAVHFKAFPNKSVSEFVQIPYVENSAVPVAHSPSVSLTLELPRTAPVSQPVRVAVAEPAAAPELKAVEVSANSDGEEVDEDPKPVIRRRTAKIKRKNTYHYDDNCNCRTYTYNTHPTSDTDYKSRLVAVDTVENQQAIYKAELERSRVLQAENEKLGNANFERTIRAANTNAIARIQQSRNAFASR